MPPVVVRVHVLQFGHEERVQAESGADGAQYW